MSKISIIALLLFGFLSITTTLALSPTIDQNYFFVHANNTLSQDLFQTRYGVIAHTIESVNNTFVSRYTLLDITSKDVSLIILDKIVSACEFASPVFQHLHHHAQTGSLVYFCPKNTSLLIIDQYGYTVQTSIPFNIQGEGPWPIAKLSTDGINVAIVGMDTLFNDNPKNSMLVKVDMQARKATTQILFDHDLFTSNEHVVAFASSKKGAYIATNQMREDTTLKTTIYSIIIIGNSYQVDLLSIFSYISPFKVVTKLFCLGNYIVTNDGQDLFFINQQGSVTPKARLTLKAITSDPNGLYQAPLISQYDGNYLYVVSADLSTDRYSVIESVITVKSIGSRTGDIQVAHGNQTSGDLMFTLDYEGTNFTIVDLKTLKATYSAISGYNDLILTDTSYAVVKSNDLYSVSEVYIFDLKTGALIKSLPVLLNYHLNKDQHIISYFNSTVSPGCQLEHVDLATGKVWTTLNFTSQDPICSGSVLNLEITEKGNPELVVPFDDHYLIITEAYGQITFPAKSSANYTNLNINFDTLSFYYSVAHPDKNQTEVTLYSYDPKSQQFKVNNSALFYDIPVQSNGFFTINTKMTLALSSSTFVLFDGFHAQISHFAPPRDWNLASSFKDSAGNQYVLGTYANTDSPKGSLPGLYNTNGNWTDLPGLRSSTVRAQAAGLKSYWLHDDVSSAFGLVRFFNAGNSKANKNLISI